MNSSFKKFLRFFISTAMLVGFGYYLQKDADFSKLSTEFSSANYWWVCATFPISFLSHWLRAIRWRTLLAPIKQKVSLTNAFSAIMVGYLVNNFIPRGGEVVRPYIFSKRENMRATTVLATVFVERMLDVVTLSLLAFFTFFLFQDKLTLAFQEISLQFPQVTASRVVSTFVVIPILLVLALVLILKTSLAAFFLRILVKPFSQKLYEKLLHHLEHFVHGFAILNSPAQYIRLFLESLPIWLLYVVPMYMTFFAFGLDKQYALTFLDANVLLVITSFAFAIAPTPGAFGVFHTFAQIALMKFYGVPNELALAYATVAHAEGYLANILLGLICFGREHALGITLKELSQEENLAIEENS